MTLALGIDLGGARIEIIALDDQGRELTRHRRPTPSDYPTTLAAVQSLVCDTETELSARGSVGIGTSGAISPAITAAAAGETARGRMTPQQSGGANISTSASSPSTTKSP